MKNKNNHKTIHLHIEHFFRHRILLALVLSFVFLGVFSSDTRFRELMRNAYAQGWGFIGTYFHHEHPSHHQASISIARIPTVSGQ